MHLQLLPLQSYFAYINTCQLSFGKVLTSLYWSIKESTSQFLLSITLFDLDEGTGDCINVTVESPCPLVISNLINPEQRDIETWIWKMAHRWGYFIGHIWRSWSGGIFSLQVLSSPIPVWSVSFILSFCLVLPIPQSLPINKIFINLFIIQVCLQQNVWKIFS